MQQAIFVNIATKGELTHNVSNFPLLPQCFQISLLIVFMVLSAADLLYVGKGKNLCEHKLSQMHIEDLA